MRITFFLAACFLAQLSFAQSSPKKEKVEYTKESALYNAKAFVAFELIEDATDSLSRFSITPLEESKSAEITTLHVKCEGRGIEGLLLGFNGERKGMDGRMHKEADFYFLSKAKAEMLLNKIEEVFEKEGRYLGDEKDNNNVFIEFEELSLIIYRSDDKSIRIFWKGFDAQWEYDESKSTKKRLMKMMK